MSALAPLKCTGCGLPAELPITELPPATVVCAACGTLVTLPPAYVEASRRGAAAAVARRAAEPLWARVSSVAPPWLSGMALALVLVLPALAAAVAALTLVPVWARVELYARVAVPALAPGALLYLWCRAVAATVVEAQFAGLATPGPNPGAPPMCRTCGASLPIELGALAASCAYCGTDSVVVDIPLKVARDAHHVAAATLGELTQALRHRRRALAAGTVALAFVIGGIAALLANVIGV